LKTGLIGEGTVPKDAGDVARLRNGLLDDRAGLGSRVRLRVGWRSDLRMSGKMPARPKRVLVERDNGGVLEPYLGHSLAGRPTYLLTYQYPCCDPELNHALRAPVHRRARAVRWWPI
jgi:hypothetical protein